MKTKMTDFYDESEMTMEENALDLADVHKSIERACDEKYEKGREHFGKAWVGSRGAVEAYDELIDAMVYLGLERKALLLDHDSESEMPPALKAQSDVIDKLLDDIRGALTGVRMFIQMTDDNHNWGRMFP